MSGGPTAAGWYPDPWYPGGLRWFDGQGWTEHAGPAAPPPADRYDAEKGRDTARWAGFAFVARGLVTGVQLAVMPLVFGRLFRSLDEPGTTPFGASGSIGFVAVAQVAGLLGLACLVGLCIWTYRATRNARGLGLPTTFDAGLAVAGWIIPLAQYVMPYLAVRDLFPEGHSGRRDAAFWWGAEISAAVLGMAALATALVAGSGPGLVIGCAAGISALTAGVLGFRITRRVVEVHAQLASAFGAP